MDISATVHDERLDENGEDKGREGQPKPDLEIP